MEFPMGAWHQQTNAASSPIGAARGKTDDPDQPHGPVVVRRGGSMNFHDEFYTESDEGLVLADLIVAGFIFAVMVFGMWIL
jgi:hypothetical protein